MKNIILMFAALLLFGGGSAVSKSIIPDSNKKCALQAITDSLGHVNTVIDPFEK
ncbi:MAG: hypothetical protein AB2L26_10455 [Ignavibacteria bacterium]